jgi:hypothetical protein
MLLLVASAAALVSAQPPPETYRSATTTTTGDIEIIRTDGRAVRISKDVGENSNTWPPVARLDNPVISKNERAVAALAVVNCGVRCEAALALVVYANGKIHRFDAQPIVHWRFDDDGARVAFSDEVRQSSPTTNFQLRDIETERVIDQVDIPLSGGALDFGGPVRRPRWVRELESSAEKQDHNGRSSSPSVH